MTRFRSVPVERRVGAVLEAAMPHVGVGTQLPSSWTPRSTPFLRIQVDGVPVSDHPICEYPTVRVVAYGSDASSVVGLARDAESHLLAASSSPGLSRVQRLTGPWPSTDPINAHPIASFTVRVTVRFDAVT